ncbi:MAG TPA: hypothetical protein O0X39_04215 [Methanocorpusculum sp.]|nr:hypothetical protein [Methanocorpusculum sp.]
MVNVSSETISTYPKLTVVSVGKGVEGVTLDTSALMTFQKETDPAVKEGNDKYNNYVTWITFKAWLKETFGLDLEAVKSGASYILPKAALAVLMCLCILAAGGLAVKSFKKVVF